MTPALPAGRPGQALALALLLLLVALLWIALVAPLRGWYAGRAEGLREQAALLAREQALAAELPALTRAARAVPSASPAQTAFLQGATDAIAGATLEQRLQAMSGQVGASLASAEALAPATDGPYHRIALKISVATDWPTLIKLLRAITTGQPAMLVDDLAFAANQAAQPGVPPISASFTVIAFRNAIGHPGNVAAATSPAVMAP